MESILVTGKHAVNKEYNNILNNMFEFRNQVFHQKLGWDVSSYDGKERDEYDDGDPVYIIAHDDNHRVEGCGRVLNTTSDYMLKDTFSELLRGEQAPARSDIMEISRLAVSPPDEYDYRQFSNHQITLDILRAAYHYGRSKGVKYYVAVTSVAMERLLRNMGFTLVRFGDGKATRVGKTLSVAVWIAMDENCANAVNGTTRYREMEVAA